MYSTTSFGRTNGFLPPTNVVCEGYVFTPVCDSVNRVGGVRGCLGGWGVCVVVPGGCVVAPGGCAWLLRGACVVAPGGGHAWLLLGGMHGCSRGHAWLLGGGMCGCSWGACLVFSGGACIGYDEIRSMSGRYASYWNAFLLSKIFGRKNEVHSQKNNTIVDIHSTSGLKIELAVHYSDCKSDIPIIHVNILIYTVYMEICIY